MACSTVVFDACVLYPSTVHNLLMRLATTGLFQAHWTERIHAEWMESLLRNRPDLVREKLERTRKLMDSEVPDALVSGYEAIEATLTLPDPDDRHVLAAAISVHADVIVTKNLSHFPSSVLSLYKVEAQTPDVFIEYQISLNSSAVEQAARRHWMSLRNPPFTLDGYLHSLQKNDLTQTAARLRELMHP